MTRFIQAYSPGAVSLLPLTILVNIDLVSLTHQRAHCLVSSENFVPLVRFPFLQIDVIKQNTEYSKLFKKHKPVAYNNSILILEIANNRQIRQSNGYIVQTKLAP